MTRQPQIVVFYDDQCGLCRREIKYYQKKAPKQHFIWQALSNANSLLEKNQICQVDALMFLHVIDQNQQCHIGLDAFVVIWRQLKYWRVLAHIVSLPIIKPILAKGYQWFAQWRFKRLSHCQIARSKQERQR